MDSVLKQRLVGAVVLVALGVIFIPMLLEGPNDTLVPELDQLPELVDPAPSRPLDAFPTMDTLPVSPDTSVLAADTAPEPLEPAPEREAPAPELQPAPAPAPQPDQAAKPPVEVAEPAQPVSSKADAEPAQAPASPPPSSPGTPKSGALGSWVLQVGSFSSQPSALALRDKLRDGGFTTQVEKVRVKGKTYYRVRVGPFLERHEAEQSLKQVAKKFKLSGRVLSYP